MGLVCQRGQMLCVAHRRLSVSFQQSPHDGELVGARATAAVGYPTDRTGVVCWVGEG